MAVKRRQHTREFKIAVVQELLGGIPPASLARQHGVHVNLLYKWREAYLKDPQNAFAGNGNLWRPEAKIAQLERTIGQLYLENEFLKKTLAWLRQQEEERTLQRR